MLSTPVPGTPLYQQMSEEGRMLRDVDYADVHGQFKFNFKHAAISRDDSKRFLDWRSGATSRPMAQVCTAFRARC
jgi:hypothetical protein